MRTKLPRLTSAALATGALAMLACSGGNTGRGGSGSSAGTCTASTVFSEGAAAANACVQCLQAKCGEQLDGYSSGCSDFIDCVCAADSAVQSCSSKASDSSCVKAAAPLGLCINASCEKPCITGEDGGAEGGSDAAGGGG
jgi:hypothetical protein